MNFITRRRHAIARRRRRNALSDSTRAALTASPDYWLTWYTVKSLALVGAAGYIGYLIGRRRK